MTYHIRIFRKKIPSCWKQWLYHIWITGLFKETRLEDSSGQEQEIRPTICMLSFRGPKKMSLEDWISLLPSDYAGITKSSFHKTVAPSFISLSLEPSVWCMVLFTKHVTVKRLKVLNSRCAKKAITRIRIVETLLSIKLCQHTAHFTYYSTDTIIPVDKN